MNYALLLYTAYSRNDEAEVLLARALELEPLNTTVLGTYALILHRGPPPLPPALPIPRV